MHFPLPLYYTYIEPEIIDLEENQIISEITINLNNSVASTKSTFVIDMPQISMKNGPFRLVHVFHNVKLHNLYLQSFIHYCDHQQQCNQCSTYINSGAS